MIELKKIAQRLKNPSVVLSIASQVVSVLILFNVDIDRNAITAVITTVCSIMVVLGIMSNPDTVNGGYGDDLHECACCHERTSHVKVGDNMVCSHCGCIQQAPVDGEL